MTTVTGDNGNNNLTGTNGADTINGRQGNDVINGLDGNDTIIAGNGNNTITDGNGNDTITAGNGTNNITAGNGNDSVTVGNGNNTVVVGNGNDGVTAGNGNNNITVGDGTDSVTVGNGNNTITAGSGADTITAGNGNNTISSGGGNDVIHTGNGNDTVNAGAGSDQVFTTGGNDLVIYNMTDNIGSHDIANGGKGTDTLRLQLTQQQFNNAAVQADLTAYHTFLAAHQNTGTDTGATFHFTAFDLSVSNFEVVNVVIVNSPVVISSGPESSTVAEQDNTTGSAAPDTTPTTPAGTLNFSDADTGDTHTVTVTLASTSDPVPAGTQADLANAVTTVLHDSTGTGNGSIDWNFAIPDHDLDFLSAGQTLTVDYNVKVSDGSTNSTQTVQLVITGANDAVAITSGPESGSVTEQPNVTGSTLLDSTSPVPTGTLGFADVDLNDAHSVSVIVDSVVWSNGTFVPGDTLNDLQAALVTTLHDSTGTGSGSIDWNFSIQDKDLDFLGAGETMTVTYDVVVSDGATSSVQQVTVTATGAEDQLVIDPVAVDVSDTSAADAGIPVASGLINLHGSGDQSPTVSVTDVNGQASNVGAEVAGTYGNLFLDSSGFYIYTANPAIDPLQVGDNAADIFTFSVEDNLGHTTSSTLTFNIHGGDDAPIITSANALGSLVEDAGPTVMVNGGFETGDLTGWISSGAFADPEFIGGQFGNYGARLSGSGFLEQDVATTAGQHYTLSFYVAGDVDASSTSLTAFWDGTQIFGQTDVAFGYTKYTFDVVGDSADPTTQLLFDFATDGSGLLVDQVSLTPTPGPATETTQGSVSFSDVETGDTHVATFTPLDSNYVGTFSVDPVTESSGSGSVEWHFSVNNADIQSLAQGQTLIQDYLVNITDNNGASTSQLVTVAIDGSNDAPTAVSETVVTDSGASGATDIPGWALAMNDTDPDTTDHLSLGSVVSSSDGFAFKLSSDALFLDDATPGGSFDYQSTDGIATSNTATATVVNNAASATTLNAAASGDSILIATNGTETLNGGSGNDILIGNSGSHTMSGGGGNDTFAFLQTTDGPGIITDFNNTTQHDHIAISAAGFGGGLTAGMDASSTFETTGDDQFSGFGAQFHFDTGNQTLYYSADGSQANAHAVTSVQSGVVLTAHDLLIV
jgi:VCBS repeat-containing protein